MPTPAAILPLLRRVHGPAPWRRWGNGVDVLVETILSQNTSNANSSAAYRQLRRELPTWNQVADAPVETVERWIRTAGLSRLKAPRIQAILRHLRRTRGRITLEFLRHYSPHAAADYLRQFPGIGPKTVNCVLLFSFGMPVFPVDTHILRIAKRLGWLPPRTSADAAHDLLTPTILPRHRYELHILLIRHGRTICKPHRPQCSRCPLAPQCPHARNQPVRSAKIDARGAQG